MLFDFGDRAARAEQARSALRAEELGLERLQGELESAVVTRADAIRAERFELEAFRDSRAYLQELVRDAEERHAHELVPLKDLLNARVQLLELERSALESRLALSLSLAALRKAAAARPSLD